jgi:hypothetical protein
MATRHHEAGTCGGCDALGILEFSAWWSVKCHWFAPFTLAGHFGLTATRPTRATDELDWHHLPTIHLPTGAPDKIINQAGRKTCAMWYDSIRGVVYRG